MNAPEPWARIRDRDPLPAPLSARSLRSLSDEDLGELLRQNLLPNPDADRRLWQRLWSVVGLDDDLADRAERQVTGMLGLTEQALDAGTLDEAGLRRASKFARQCVEALARIDRAPDEPLGWAGTAAAGFNPPARKVLQQLVIAVDAHRDATTNPTTADRTLWQILRQVDLDPVDHLGDERPWASS